MITPMKKRLIISTIVLGSMMGTPVATMAQKAPTVEQELDGIDARMYGYKDTVSLSGGTALTYFALGILGLICLGGMFKDSRRTHLD